MSATFTTEDKRRRVRDQEAEPALFRLMAWAVFLSVLVMLGSAIAMKRGSVSSSWSELLLWGLLAAATSLMPLSLEGGPALAMDLPVLLAAGFVHGPAFAG
ncbi:MAG: hypothetical protein ACXVEI_12700, partial [Actinomycetota bacterium]